MIQYAGCLFWILVLILFLSSVMACLPCPFSVFVYVQIAVMNVTYAPKRHQPIQNALFIVFVYCSFVYITFLSYFFWTLFPISTSLQYVFILNLDWFNSFPFSIWQMICTTGGFCLHIDTCMCFVLSFSFDIYCFLWSKSMKYKRSHVLFQHVSVFLTRRCVPPILP